MVCASKVGGTFAAGIRTLGVGTVPTGAEMHPNAERGIGMRKHQSLERLMKTITAVGFLLLFLFNACHKDEPCSTCPPSGPDTTSHLFAWKVELLGDGGGSILHDVAIINDTLAYAVGEIYLRDSTGQLDPILYNVAVWNGSRWSNRRIPYFYQGPTYGPINWIFAFSERDIWFGNSVHWDGQQFHNADIGTSVFNGVGSNKMWGGRRDELYVVGNNGTVAYSSNTGATWRRMETGTTLRMMDIWGANDPETGQRTVLAVASGSSPDQGKRLLDVGGGTVKILPDSGLSWSLSALWFVPNRKYYVVGAGIHQKNSLNDAVWTSYPSGFVTSYHSEAIRGNGINDVFVVGDFFEVVHFNGASWYNYSNEIPTANGAFGAVAVKGNLVIGVGLLGQQAVTLIGKR
jgi:hypothetical protein